MKWLVANRVAAASADALCSGLKLLGESFEMLDPTSWSDHFWITCDVAVVFGIRQNEQAFIESAKRRGIPTIVVDLGYVNRFDENYRAVFERDRTLQLSIGDNVGCIPQLKCPPDRRIRLNLTYPGMRGDRFGPIVVMGQWPSDPTHPFSDSASILAWVKELQELVGNEIPIKYRPHPRLIKSDEFLEKALVSARAVVTWSSNSGHDALLSGIPVATKCGPYASICEDVDNLYNFSRMPWFPSEEEWEQYFNRMAYGQWSFDELADGTAIKFALAVLAGEDPFWGRTNVAVKNRRNSILVDGVSGLGDNVYQRPFVQCAAAEHETVFLKTPWPELYSDLRNVKFVEYREQYRTQKKNLEASSCEFVPAPAIKPVKLGYGPVELRHSSIMEVFGRQLPPNGSPFVFDLPPVVSKFTQTLPGRFVLVRPVTVRNEWRNSARNPLPEYITAAVTAARAAGFIIISVADVDDENETFCGTPPVADFTWNRGECSIVDLIALVSASAGIISGVGWAVPFALAAKKPLLCILGGNGGHNAPHIVAPPNIVDSSRVVWAVPDRFCMCDKPLHDKCDKRISELPVAIDQFISRLGQLSPDLSAAGRRRRQRRVETPPSTGTRNVPVDGGLLLDSN